MRLWIIEFTLYVIAIFLAIRTKQVFISLITGIWIGWVILSDFNLFTGTIATIDAVVNVFKDAGNTCCFIYITVGALMAFMQKSGGIDGFIKYMSRIISDDKKI